MIARSGTDSPRVSWLAVRKTTTLVAVLGLMALGLFFRFTNLGGKAYWFDEAMTSLRIHGITTNEMNRALITPPRILTMAELSPYQAPGAGTTWRDTIRSLAREEPQHPPLYFVTARAWSQVFGASVGSIRALSALFSLLVFPCAFWLCRELFRSPAVAWIAMVLIAVSPFQVLQAQTARQTSLWIATVLLASAALLWALRRQSGLGWLVYALALALACQVFLFSVLVAFAHALYVLCVHVLDRQRWRALVPFVAAQVVAGATLLSWAFEVLASWSEVAETTSWSSTSMPLRQLIQAWLVGFSRVFLDLNNQATDRPAALLPLFCTAVLVAILFAQGLRILWRTRREDRGLFLLFLLFGSILPLVAHDLLRGGQLSAAHRYFAPAYVALQLIVARALAGALHGADLPARRFGLPATGLLVTLGVVSCARSAPADAWWNKDPNSLNPQIAQAIAASGNPVLLSDGWTVDLLSLTHVLPPHVRLLVAPPPSDRTAGVQQTPPLDQPGLEGPLLYVNLRPYVPGPYRDWFEKRRAEGAAEPLVTTRGFTALWRLRRSGAP